MTTSTEKSYFDLHITGLGYLNRIREVKPKKEGDSFLACDIAALNGPSDDVSYVRFDTRVSGSEAQHRMRRRIQAVDAEKKVMIGLRLGDLWTDPVRTGSNTRWMSRLDDGTLLSLRPHG